MVALPNNGGSHSPSSPKGRRIVVSHRLPLRAVLNPDAKYGFDFSLDPDALPFKHSRGLPGSVVFVGTLPAAAASVPASEELTAHLLTRFSCIPVFLDEQLHKNYYQGFCMTYLWPLLHDENQQWSCVNGGRDFNEEHYGAYISANTRFAERVLQLLGSPGEDHVYIHDYHLLSLPSILRQESPGTRIYLTLHSAFPTYHVFRFSPIAKDLVSNILNADLVAFVSWQYHYSGFAGFVSACTKFLEISCHNYFRLQRSTMLIDYMDRTVVVKSITASSGKACHLREMLTSPETAAIVKDISTKYKGRKLLLNVEDDDDNSTCHSKLVAMEKLLESQPELRGQAVLVMLINTWQLASDEVLAIRDRINSSFGFPGYEPVMVINAPRIHEQLAFYMLAGAVTLARWSSSGKKISFYYRACQVEGAIAHRSTWAPQNGDIDNTIQVNSSIADVMADQWRSMCRVNEQGKQIMKEAHYSYDFSMDDDDAWTRSFEQDFETACKSHESAKVDDFFSNLVFSQQRIILMNNSLEYHRVGMYRSVLQDYVDKPLELVKASALEVTRKLKVMCSDPNNTISSVSVRRKDDKPAIWPAQHKLVYADISGPWKNKPFLWLALHKLMYSDFGYSTRFQPKTSPFSERLPNDLAQLIQSKTNIAQLIAACNSSASAGAGQSGMALLDPSRRPNVRLLLDSGASINVVSDAELLHNLRHLPRAAARFATLPDGSRLPIIGLGTIQMPGFHIPNVYLVEGVTVNLVSVSRLAVEHNICCCFFGNRCQLMVYADGRTRVVGEALLGDDGVYGLRFLRIPGATA